MYACMCVLWWRCVRETGVNLYWLVCYLYVSEQDFAYRQTRLDNKRAHSKRDRYMLSSLSDQETKKEYADSRIACPPPVPPPKHAGSYDDNAAFYVRNLSCSRNQDSPSYLFLSISSLCSFRFFRFFQFFQAPVSKYICSNVLKRVDISMMVMCDASGITGCNRRTSKLSNAPLLMK